MARGVFRKQRFFVPLLRRVITRNEGTAPEPTGRIMSSLAGSGGLAAKGGIAGKGGGLAG